MTSSWASLLPICTQHRKSGLPPSAYVKLENSSQLRLERGDPEHMKYKCAND